MSDKIQHPQPVSNIDDRRLMEPRAASPESVLANLLHTIMYERGITAMSLGAVVGRFLERYEIPNTRISPDRKNNLIKELKASTMTWRSFINNLPLLGIVKFRITVTVYDRQGNSSDHSLMTTIDHEEIVKEILK